MKSNKLFRLIRFLPLIICQFKTNIAAFRSMYVNKNNFCNLMNIVRYI